MIVLVMLTACSSPPLRIQSGDVPAASLRVAQVIAVANRQDIVNTEAYKAIIAAGVADADIQDGSVVMMRIYCCGGMSQELSSEFVHRKMAYVPKGMKLEPGDFVEIKVGRPPERGDGGRLNTVIRVVGTRTDSRESCWWEPKNDKLWLRVPYCDWMPAEGWVKQGGLNPAWFKPVP